MPPLRPRSTPSAKGGRTCCSRLATCPERVALTYAAKRPRGLDLALSAALAAPDRRADVLDALIRSRRLILDELAARAHTLRTTGPQMSATSQRAQQARQRFANLLVRSLDEPVARSLMDKARQEKEDAERALAEESASERAEIARAAVGLDEVRHALPAGSVLVSFVQFNRSTRRLAVGMASSKTPSIAAFVLRSGQQSVALVPLGTVANIEQRVSAFRLEASGTRLLSGRDPETAMLEYRRAGDVLRQMIWDPIGAHLRDATRMFVVPDGAIGLVPFAALPAEAHIVPARTLAADLLPVGGTGPRGHDRTSADRRPGDSGPRRTGLWRRRSCDCRSGLSSTRARSPRCVSGKHPLRRRCAERSEPAVSAARWHHRRGQEIPACGRHAGPPSPSRCFWDPDASETTFKQSAHRISACSTWRRTGSS